MVKPGDAQSLLEAISKSSVMNADSMSERLFILIPDGFYDLGETALTTIWGHNVALIGFALDGLDPLERHSAGLACWITGPKVAVHEWPKNVYYGSYVETSYG